MYYSNVCRGISPGESYFSADYRAPGTDELMEQPKFKLIFPDVDTGKAFFFKWRHILIMSRQQEYSHVSLIPRQNFSHGNITRYSLKQVSQYWQSCENILPSSPHTKHKLLHKSVRKITISLKIFKQNSVESNICTLF